MSKPKIVLIHPPHPEASEDRLDAPLGLLLIAGMLRKNGFEVEINDLQGVQENEWKVGEGDLYGVTMYASSLSLLPKIAKEIDKIRGDGARIIVGGAHVTSASFSLNSMLSDGMIHSVSIGEGEIAMVQAAVDYPNIKGYYRGVLGDNLDDYYFPTYDLVDLSSYKRTIDGRKSVTILSSRGCQFHCAFCALPPQNRKIKRRSPKKVADEMKELKMRYGIEAFNFQDDCLTTDKEYMSELMKLIAPLDIRFRCHGRAGIDSLMDYIKLKDAGCALIAWGIESGSQKMLDKMKKGVKVQDNINVIRWAKEAGITSRAFFIFGFPGEDEDTIKETKRFIEVADPDQYFVSSFIPYPGTRVWDEPHEFGITKIDDNFAQFYQVDKTGYGGVCFETADLSKEKFVELEIDFRKWMSKRKRRGKILEYEKRIENGSENI